jgi:phosphoglycolate phosphatase-like HAD superfamily hydrolase
MATIGVDVDSTLYDFETPSRDAALKLWQETGDDGFKEAAYHPWTEWRSPADVLMGDDGVPHRWLEVIGRVHEDDSILSQRPFTGAVETCQALMEAGHKLIYITNRKAHTEAATEQWLRQNGFMSYVPLSEVYATGSPAELVVTEGDKSPYLKKAQYLIDDRLKTCVQFVYDYEWQFYNGERDAVKGPANRDRIAFVKAYPYNQNATDIPGLILAPTWAAINVYLVKKGLLPQAAAVA